MAIDKTIAVIVLLTLPPCICFSDSSAGNLSKLSASLDRTTARDLNAAVVSNRWCAPSIPSKWRLERESDADERSLGAEARAFGKGVAQLLEVWASELADNGIADRNQEICSSLLDLANWLASTPGYGNYILAARAQDVATVGIGRLVADLHFPFESASTLVARLDCAWQSPEARALVLNAEAGTNLFPANPASATDALNEVWRNGQVLLIKHGSPQARAAFEENAKDGHGALTSIVKLRGVRPNESPMYMSNLDFFRDDPVAAQGRPVTTLRKWDAKWHGRIVVGLQSMNARKLKALLSFRQHVGAFPDRPKYTAEQEAASKAEIEAARKRGIKIVPFEAAFASHGEAAFAQAWEPFAAKETRTLYAAAWGCYSEITSGLFMDDDTRETRLNEKLSSPTPTTR